MDRGRLCSVVAELRSLYEACVSSTNPQGWKARNAFVTRLFEQPDILPLILDAADGTLDAVKAAEESLAACMQSESELPIAFEERLRNGENPVKVYREYRRMTQKELARSLGVTQPLVGRIEISKSFDFRLSTLLRLADALDVSVINLIPRNAPRRD